MAVIIILKLNIQHYLLITGLLSQTCNLLTFNNVSESSLPITYENVESIRNNAPDMFRMGGRLVTVDDYKVYILSKFSNRINDVYVCNNTTYVTQFYSWLNKYNKLSINIRKDLYLYADACDFNNIYLWLKPNYEGQVSEKDMTEILNACLPIKTATSELVPCQAVNVSVIPYVNNPLYKYDIIKELNGTSFKSPVKILVKKQPNTFINNTQVKETVNNIIVEYFSLKNQKMGNIIDISEIYKRIMETGYIESVSTQFIAPDDPNNTFKVEGLSFGFYTSTVLNCADFEIINKSKTLLPFQYVSLYTKSLLDAIEVINDDSYVATNT